MSALAARSAYGSLSSACMLLLGPSWNSCSGLSHDLKAFRIPHQAVPAFFPVLPKDDLTKRIVNQAIEQLNTASKTVEELRTLMNETAAKLPEYSVVMGMKGVGPSLGLQLMAEIGDVTRFTHKGAITAFAGVNPGVNKSGAYEQKSVLTSKRGSSSLRKTLFQVMDCLIKTKPQDDPAMRL